MKTDIHPTLNPVLFVDTSTGDEWVSRSTMKSKEVRKIEGVDHFVVKLEISAYSHPFWTGQMKLLDAAGRIDRFKKRFAATGGKTIKAKPKKKVKRKLTGVVKKTKKTKKTLSTAPKAQEGKGKGGKKAS